MGSERESLIVSLQPGRWKGKSDKERARKKLPEIKAKQGISKHQKCRTLDMKIQRHLLVITDYYVVLFNP